MLYFKVNLLRKRDIDLGYKPKKAYDDAAKEFRVNKAKYYAIIKRNLKEGGAAWTAARRFDDACDLEGLLKFTLNSFAASS